MYTTLDDIIVYMKETSYFNIYTYEIKTEKEIVNFEHQILIKLPYIDEAKTCEIILEYLNGKPKFTKVQKMLRMHDTAEILQNFHCFIYSEDKVDDWHEFERTYLKKIAEDWCVENGIQYTWKDCF